MIHMSAWSVHILYQELEKRFGGEAGDDWTIANLLTLSCRSCAKYMAALLQRDMPLTYAHNVEPHCSARSFSQSLTD